MNLRIKNLGTGKRILGIEIIRDRKNGYLFLSQSGYSSKVIKLFGIRMQRFLTHLLLFDLN